MTEINHKPNMQPISDEEDKEQSISVEEIRRFLGETFSPHQFKAPFYSAVPYTLFDTSSAFSDVEVTFIDKPFSLQFRKGSIFCIENPIRVKNPLISQSPGEIYMNTNHARFENQNIYSSELVYTADANLVSNTHNAEHGACLFLTATHDPNYFYEDYSTEGYFFPTNSKNRHSD